MLYNKVTSDVRLVFNGQQLHYKSVFMSICPAEIVSLGRGGKIDLKETCEVSRWGREGSKRVMSNRDISGDLHITARLLDLSPCSK